MFIFSVEAQVAMCHLRKQRACTDIHSLFWVRVTEGARIRELGVIFVCGVGEEITELHKLWGIYYMESSANYENADVFTLWKGVYDILYSKKKELQNCEAC